MKKLFTAVLLLSATMAFAQNDIESKIARGRATDENGVATHITGHLGRLDANVAESAKNILRAQKDLLQATGVEEFEALGVYHDDLGQTHVRLQERLHGRPVIGAEYIVHADADGNVFAANGRFAPGRKLPREATVDGWSAIQRAAEQAGISNGAYEAWPELVYVVNDRGNAFLAWSVKTAYVSEQGEELDILYADATSGDLVLRAPQIHRARNRNTYNGNNGSSLPGTLILTETTGSTTDAVISTAHTHAGTSYDYYKNVHNRDSYNNAGAQIKTTVHHQVGYNNAFWNGSQLVYGDGDGVQFLNLGNALDVGAHELTHAVTTYSANLTYSNESGALNEATSDIMAAAVEAWKDGAVSSDTWKVGEDITTPGTAGDALRYMNDPIADGSSYDYYPTRYTGSGDYGGVHLNSGIANLAFKLMVTGGTHPRGKTTVNVPALSGTALTSIDMGAKIWYRALTVYMTSSTNFSGARTATANAATDLYGATAAAAVHKAWDAVGAPGGTPPPSTVVTLTNGVAVTGIGASTGTWKHYKIAVPSGQSSLAIVQSGGSGDADLYVKIGSQPTSSSYNYRPYLSGNNESVNVTNPVAGDWYISIYAYSTYSSVSLKATYTGTAPPPACTSVSGSLSGTGANYYSAQYSSSISGAHTGKLTGPSGTDFDLYLQKWNGSSWSSVAAGESSTSTENVSYNGTSGTYRWRVYSYTGSGSFTLCTTKP
ncbi:MAG TPA: M4 family metallopeptidase [Thermoanaerobaculia bacterium]|nr:M4 family metallopeptidase [Thermoanaerobaculia bacterium]